MPCPPHRKGCKSVYTSEAKGRASGGQGSAGQEMGKTHRVGETHPGVFLSHGRDAAHGDRHIVRNPATAPQKQMNHQQNLESRTGRWVDERRHLLNKRTRVLALQLLDGNLHLLRGQLPTEDGCGCQVPPVARVTRDKKVVPVEEAEDDEGKVIAGGKVDGVSIRLEGNDDG